MNRILDGIDRPLTAIAGVALGMMVMVVMADIVGRSLGFWHILSTPEQTTLYMMILGFFGLARCFRTEGNIVVDVATQSLGEIATRRLDGFWSVVTAIVIAPLAVLSVRDGLTFHGYGQRSEVLGISPLLHHAIAGAGLAMTALVSVIVGLRLMRGLPGSGAPGG